MEKNKIKFLKFSFIFYENPIARCYLNCFLDNGLINLPIIYIGKNSKYGLFRRYKFYSNNHYPLNFLANDSLSVFIYEVEKFFNLRENFFRDAYDYKNLKKFQNISFINTNSINSIEAIKVINSSINNDYLISYQEILKDILKTNKNFFHIHPGYLPKIKGADGSLHSVLNYNEIGASLFKIVTKIDEGPIIYRKLSKFKKFSSNHLKNWNNKDLYRLWFSFFDPALRCSILIDYLNNMFTLDDRVELNKQESNKYFTFMKTEDLSKVFKKIIF